MLFEHSAAQDKNTGTDRHDATAWPTPLPAPDMTREELTMGICICRVGTPQCATSITGGWHTISNDGWEIIPTRKQETLKYIKKTEDIIGPLQQRLQELPLSFDKSTCITSYPITHPSRDVA
ncbi:unnamed protein product [Vitrella brassicaformis CCMP3155]|uniref:Uncharacterized protein n=1 Tax=Vitrella brassicaformis (strain CCMP3155) TaxID=1169540 RepID=A0A0G4EBG8_VITBC|nr:unnamed protein product [Vitrella brassicaformis CCMP3155]|eukprot:CEL92861.1 unnamed protein product [Vitrella brassicaformis CCMP3155]